MPTARYYTRLEERYSTLGGARKSLQACQATMCCGLKIITSKTSKKKKKKNLYQVPVLALKKLLCVHSLQDFEVLVVFKSLSSKS